MHTSIHTHIEVGAAWAALCSIGDGGGQARVLAWVSETERDRERQRQRQRQRQRKRREPQATRHIKARMHA
jgi:hypothetical protein